jgi:hypothetical protein
MKGNIQPSQDNWMNLGTPSRYLAAVRTYSTYNYDAIYTNVRGVASTNVGIFPWVAGTGYCGRSDNYWERMYSSDVAYRNLYTFRDRDDLDLIKRMHSRVKRVPRREATQVRGEVSAQSADTIEVMNPDDAPPELLENGFYLASAVQGLAISALAQVIERLEALEARVP